MQGTDEPILLYAMLREWFNNLKPLYIMINSFIDKDKLTVNDKKNLIGLMQKAGNACQKLIDFEEDIKHQFETLGNEVSVLKTTRFDISAEVDDLELKKGKLLSKYKLLKKSVTESSEYLNNTIEQVKKLNIENAKIAEKIERQKDEEIGLDKRIDEKKALLKKIGSLDPMSDLLKDQESEVKEDIVSGGDEDTVSKNLFLSSRLEIFETILSMLDTVIPNLKQVWNMIREILECKDQKVIEYKINSIANLVADSSKFDGHTDEPQEELKQEKKIKFDEELKKEFYVDGEVKFSIDSNEALEQLSKKLAFLNIECETREQKSNELLSKIELRNVALSKLEEYFEVVKNDIVLLENQYNDLKEKIKSIGSIDKNDEPIQATESFDEKFYFDEYYKKITSFYENEKNKVRTLIGRSYEKLKNNERLLTLKQRELAIIDGRAKKEFPNYELTIANLRLKLSKQDEEIELLNNSIKQYIEKDNMINLELASHKKDQDSVTNERELLLQKIIKLEDENKKLMEDYNNLKAGNQSIKEGHDTVEENNDQLKENYDVLQENNDALKKLLNESQIECEDYKSKISELENQISELKNVKVSSQDKEDLSVSQDQSVEQDSDVYSVDGQQENELDNEIKENYDALQGNYDALKKLLNESQTECENYKSKVSELENRISELENVKASNQDKEDLSNSQDQSVEQDSDVYSVDGRQENELGNEIKENYDALQENYDALKKLLDEAQAECENYKSKISELENRISELENVKASSQDKEDLSDSQGQSVEQDSDVDIVDGQQEDELDNEIKEKYDALQENNDALKKLLDELQTECENYKSKISELENQISELKNVNYSLEIDKLKTELSEQISKRNNAEKSLLEIEKLNVSLSNQISKRDNLIKEYEEEIQNLKEKRDASSDVAL